MNKVLALILSLLAAVAPLPALASADAPSLVGTTCDICHFCPQPLGFCVLLWAAAVLVLLIIITALLGRKKRCPVCKEKNKLRAEICVHCQYNFNTGALPLIPDQGGYAQAQAAEPPRYAPATARDSSIWTDRSATANQPIPTSSRSQLPPEHPPTYTPPAPPVYEAPPAPPAYEPPPAPPVYEAPPAPPVYEAPPAPPVYEAPPAPVVEEPIFAPPAAAVEEPAFVPPPAAVKAAPEAETDTIPVAVRLAAVQKPLYAPPAASDLKPCPHCGKVLPARAMFCSECGNRIE